jgi:hypothetical protein
MTETRHDQLNYINQNRKQAPTQLTKPYPARLPPTEAEPLSPESWPRMQPYGTPTTSANVSSVLVAIQDIKAREANSHQSKQRWFAPSPSQHAEAKGLAILLNT